MPTTRPLYSHYIPTIFPLHAHYTPTTRPLHAHYMPTTRPLHAHYMPTTYPSTQILYYALEGQQGWKDIDTSDNAFLAYFVIFQVIIKNVVFYLNCLKTFFSR